MTPLKIAVAKGYLLSETFSLLKKGGFDFDEPNMDSRKLFSTDKKGEIKLLHVRPWDVPVYVQEGAADLGIVGQDVLQENPSHTILLKDLKFGACRLVLAGPQKNTPPITHHIRIATKYPNCTQAYFQERGLKVHLIKLYGAIELAPLTGLSDLICDLSATGKTLQEHHLHILDTLIESSARLIANPISFKVDYHHILDWCQRLETLLGT